MLSTSFFWSYELGPSIKHCWSPFLLSRSKKWKPETHVWCTMSFRLHWCRLVPFAKHMVGAHLSMTETYWTYLHLSQWSTYNTMWRNHWMIPVTLWFICHFNWPSSLLKCCCCFFYQQPSNLMVPAVQTQWIKNMNGLGSSDLKTWGHKSPDRAIH